MIYQVHILEKTTSKGSSVVLQYSPKDGLKCQKLYLFYSLSDIIFKFKLKIPS